MQVPPPHEMVSRTPRCGRLKLAISGHDRDQCIRPVEEHKHGTERVNRMSAFGQSGHAASGGSVPI